MATVDDRYKELQAEFTRRSQELSELRKRIESGELVDPREYAEQIRQWVRENPEEAMQWLGLEGDTEGDSDLGTEDSPGGDEPEGAPLAGLDISSVPDDVFDPNSETHQRLKREYGEKGIREIILRKYGADLLGSSPVGAYLEEIQSQVQELAARYEQRLAELDQKLEEVDRYAKASWDEIVAARDPRVRTIQTIQEELRQDPSKWFDIAEALEYYRTQAGQGSAQGEGGGSGRSEGSSDTGSEPSPESLRARQRAAESTSEGSGPRATTGAAEHRDLWERAVAEARAESGL